MKLLIVMTKENFEFLLDPDNIIEFERYLHILSFRLGKIFHL